MATRRARDGGRELAILNAELLRLARRADLQRRRIKQGTEAWQRWSATIDEGLAIAGRIGHVPAHDFAGLATKFRAILWRIHVDEEVIMDEEVRRTLKRFGRQLAQFSRR